jgi:hypothetical protein
MYMSYNSEVHMHNCFSVRAFALMHVGLGPDHEGLE